MLIIPEKINGGKPLFVYCSYWRTWSRLIAFNPYLHYTALELNLTPIGGLDPRNREWDERIRPVVFRIHCTARGQRDRVTLSPPEEVLRSMIRVLGADKVEYLLATDFYPQIDLKLCKERSNGGCPFELCKKEPIG